MEKTLDRRARYTLRAIRCALYELMEEHPLEKIPVTRLCRLADVNRGTFYHYYRDVFDLYEQLEEEFLSAMRAILSAPDADINALLALMEENRALLRPGADISRAARLSGRIRAAALPCITARLNSRADAALLAEFILGGCGQLFGMWLHEELAPPQLLSALHRFTENSMRFPND